MRMYVSVTGLLFSSYTFEDMLDSLRKLRIEYFELPHPLFYKGIYKGTLKPLLAEVEDVKELVASRGLKLSTVNAGNNFVQTNEDEFRRQVEGVKVCCDLSVEFGCNIVRIFGGDLKAGLTEQDCVNLITKGIRECVDYAEQRNVSLALENHGRITNNYELELKLLETIGSESFKLNVDTGNYYWYGYPLNQVCEILDELAEHAIHTHMKNGTSAKKDERREPGNDFEMKPLEEGDIPLEAFVRGLKRMGYAKAISIEDESINGEDLEETLRKDNTFLQRIMESP